MKYSLTGQQAFFFEKYGYIEFEHLLDDEEIRTLSDALKKSKLKRNIASENQAVRKILFSKGFAELASRLCQKKKLRYGFDEVVQNPVVRDGFAIAAGSCIAPLSLCLLLCVEGSQTEKIEAQDQKIDPFPTMAGNGVFFRPNSVWDITCLSSHRGQKGILLSYADERVQYLYCLEDEHLHDLKRDGLVFGDRLPEKTHPYLYR